MSKKRIESLLRERILVLDGGLGTMLQGFGLKEADFRGERFTDWSRDLMGCNEALVLNRPDVVRSVHESYLKAGADIVSTDTFNATQISLRDYGLEGYAYEINRCAAQIARAVADEYSAIDSNKPRFVAGSVGPTNRTASMSADINDPALRAVTFDDLTQSYSEQIRGLLDGGADIILVETIFDTLNAKAAVYAFEQERLRRGSESALMLSVTLSDASGRTLSGQTIEAFHTSMAHARPLSIGMNCAYGAEQMMPYLERLSEFSEFAISAHPNAGLPNISGGYDETPEMMSRSVEEYLRRGLVNIIGGCCGTTPKHIECFSQLASRYQPRKPRTARHATQYSGLELLEIGEHTNFINVGERTNVAGSARFARMIREGRYGDALAVAREQVDAGANIIDICMDDGLIDGVEAMLHFLNLVASEPEIARVPIMIDSSSWEVLEQGLKCVQGKSVVNSISLKEGEDEFLDRAKSVRMYGAAVVVMLFDERGQADTFARKIEVAQRAYDLLVEDGFASENIIFDPNVLAVATGIEEHDNYGVDFIEAVRWIKQNLPNVRISGGISNLSFSFRGNNIVREAMHSVFLYHAIGAGLDMGIVNPAMLQLYTEIEPQLLELCEDVVMNRRKDAGERLTEYAQGVDGSAERAPEKVKKWREQSVEERVKYAMMRGETEYIEQDTMEAYAKLGEPLEVIDRVLMPAMEHIGKLFGEGKMFLPQVVKSARVMRGAVGVLTPYMKSGAKQERKTAGRVLLATVKGDVHDIGKNIVSVVVSCNGYLVEDMGVMVDGEDILAAVERLNVDVVGLSGLITPSLEEMIRVVRRLEDRGIKTPVVVGGATTSALHTAVKIAPEYSGLVIHSRDASEMINILNKLLRGDLEEYEKSVREAQKELRRAYTEGVGARKELSLEEARKNRFVKRIDDVVVPKKIGRVVLDDFPIQKVVPYIDWRYFMTAWGIKGRFPDILKTQEQAAKLMKDAELMLQKLADEKWVKLSGVVGIYRAVAQEDTIVVYDEDEKEYQLPQLRSLTDYSKNGKESAVKNLSVADMVLASKNETDDYIGLFALTAGEGLNGVMEQFRKQGDEYSAIMAKFLTDRLAEAFCEAVHSYVRREIWGYETIGEPSVESILKGEYDGIRVAFGYSAVPDHAQKRIVFDILKATQTTKMKITENNMIIPAESLCGIFLPPVKGVSKQDVYRIRTKER